jgi:sulfoxide reductase heme-binding subunit YedZ
MGGPTVSAATSRPAFGAQRLFWLKPGVALGGLIPLAYLVRRSLLGELGADPIAAALNELGMLALILLVATLAATPLRLLFGVTWPLRIRRMLGLLSFFYALLHFLVYALLDQGFDLAAITADVIERPFITLGFVALCLLVPLALTSTRKMHKRLGPRRWQRLHRLVYVVALLAAGHFVLRVKQDLTEPLIYGALIGLLLFVRLRKPRALSS